MSSYLNFASLANLFGKNTTTSSLLGSFGSYMFNGGTSSTSVFGYGNYNNYGNAGTNPYGYNTNYDQAAKWRTQLSTATIISIAMAILPWAGTKLSDIINGAIQNKLDKLNTTNPTPKSSVTDNLLKQNDKAKQATLEDNFLQYGFQSDLLGSTPVDNLKNILNGESSNIPGNSKLKESGVSGLQDKLKTQTPGNTSKVDFSSIDNDSKDAEGKPYLKLSDDAKEVFKDFKNTNNTSKFNVAKYEATPKPKDGYDLDYIKAEKANVYKHITTIKDALEQYEAFADIPDFNINDLGSIKTAKISVTIDGKNVDLAYDTGYPTEIESMENGDAKTAAMAAYDNGKAAIDTARENAVETINAKLKTAKETAKKEADKLKEQQQILEEYQTNLDDIELDNPDALNNNEYLMQLSNGQQVKTAGDLLKLKEKEQEEAYQILSNATGVSVDDLKEKAKDGTLNQFISDNSTSIQDQKKKIDNKKTQTETDLQLMDFIKDGYKELGNDSQITRGQLNKLQAKARELLAQPHVEGQNKWATLQQYAAGMGIKLSDPQDAATHINKNNKTQKGDTNNNGAVNNWTTSATDGADLKMFADENGFDINVLKQKYTNGKITREQAEALKKEAGEQVTSYKNNIKAKFGDLDSYYGSSIIDFTLNLRNVNQGDKYKTHVNNSEDKAIQDDLNKEMKNMRADKKVDSKIEKNKEDIIAYMGKNGITEFSPIKVTQNKSVHGQQIVTYTVSSITTNSGKKISNVSGTDLQSFKAALDAKLKEKPAVA